MRSHQSIRAKGFRLSELQGTEQGGEGGLRFN